MSFRAQHFGLLILLMATSAVGACVKSPVANPNKSASQLVSHIAKRAQNCWFKGNNAPFKNNRLALETNSHSGKPRFLIVPKRNPSGLPILVVQATREGGKNQLEQFGPALNQKNGARISKDIANWANGGSKC